MHSFTSLTLGLAALHTLVLAFPTVTPVALAGGCASYPEYDASTGIAGPWIIQLNSCENSTIEGFGDNSQLIRRNGDTGIHEGRVCNHLITKFLCSLPHPCKLATNTPARSPS